MKNKILIILSLMLLIVFTSCDDKEQSSGNPQLELSDIPAKAFFGDSIPFSAAVKDLENIPLSTVKAQLFFGDDKVQETAIRTKEYGEYKGKIYIPFLKNIPNGEATLKIVVQNINFGVKEEIIKLPLERPVFEKLILIAEEEEYDMNHVEGYNYVANDDFPLKVHAKILAPAYGVNGNDIYFGMSSGEIKEGLDSEITFSNSYAGVYDISFNTLTYTGAPFISLKFAGQDMLMKSDDIYQVDIDLETNQEIEVDGIPDIEEWWIDPDFIEKNEDGAFKFLAMGYKYRVTANFEKKYFNFEMLDGSDYATLNADGSGAVWIIGTDIGKPSLQNEVGWNTDNALCFAPIADKKYQITLEAGKNVNTSAINFKFFHQKGWGGEFSNESLSTDSEIVFVGDGDNGRDPGNLGLVEDVELTSGTLYIFTLDLSGGTDNGVLYVEEK